MSIETILKQQIQQMSTALTFAESSHLKAKAANDWASRSLYLTTPIQKLFKDDLDSAHQVLCSIIVAKRELEARLDARLNHKTNGHALA